MISIIIPIKPHDEHIDYCLEALYKSTYTAMEVILVLDGWQKSFKKPPAGIQQKVIQCPKRGPAFCRNTGAKAANAEMLCFMDADVEVHPDTIEKAIQIVTEEKLDGLIGAYDTSPTVTKTVSTFRNLLHHYHHKINNKALGVFWGAFGMIKKSAFAKMNGFNETFVNASIEDVELGYRLYQAGFKVSLESSIQVKHRKNWSFWNMVRTDIFLRAKPWTVLLNRYRLDGKQKLNTSKREKYLAIFSILGFITLGIAFFYPIAFAFLAGYILIFVLLQKDFYQLLLKKMNPTNLPTTVFLHHTYYYSAMIGFALGKLTLLTHEKERLPK